MGPILGRMLPIRCATIIKQADGRPTPRCRSSNKPTDGPDVRSMHQRMLGDAPETRGKDLLRMLGDEVAAKKTNLRQGLSSMKRKI